MDTNIEKKYKLYINRKKLVVFCCITVLCLNLDSLIVYACLALCMLVWLCLEPNLLDRKNDVSFIYSSYQKFSNFCIDLIPILLFLLWMWGVVLGFLKHNNFVFIVSNFAGMFFYSFYYILRNLNKKTLLKIVLFSGVFNLLFTLVVFSIKTLIPDAFYLIKPFLGKIVHYGAIDENMLSNRVYYVNQVTIFSLLAFDFRLIALKQFNTITSWFIIIITLVTLSTIPISKGYILAIMIYGILYLTIRFIVTVYRKIPPFIYLLFIMFFLVTILIFLDTTYGSLAVNIFSTSQQGNSVRIDKALAILTDLNIIGHGLGSPLPGIARGPEFAPYGTEVIHLNLLHKFGLIGGSMCLFAYVSTFGLIVGKIAKSWGKVEGVYGILSLSVMSYFWVSLGNPILFHPSAVMLHCIALLLIKDSKLN